MTAAKVSPFRWGAVGAAAVLVACNGLLDNDRRFWDPESAEGGDSGDGAGGRSHTAGTGSGAGRSGGGALNGGGAGDGHGAGEGGEAGSIGEAGGAGRPDGGSSGAGGPTAGTGGGSCATKPNACTPGAMGSELVACGVCSAGTATRTRVCQSDCTWGVWSAPSECQIAVACEPGQTAMQMESCGACMTGTRVQSRTCTDSCTWGEWGAFGECTGVTAACTAGDTESRAVGCPCAGSKTQSRTCSASCTWGGWSDTSGCDIECCSEIVYCNTPDNITPASRGTWCRRTDPDCSNDELTNDCMQDATSVCGGVVPELYIQY